MHGVPDASCDVSDASCGVHTYIRREYLTQSMIVHTANIHGVFVYIFGFTNKWERR